MTAAPPLPRKTNGACPICGKPRTERYAPFCSRRCADIDLHRWMSGVYAVPAADGDEEDEAPVRPGPGSDD